MSKTVVVKGPARRPTVISSSAIAELAPQNVTVLVEDYHEEALSLNFQFMVGDAGCSQTLASVQAVARTDANELMHVGNLRPAGIVGEQRLRGHASAAMLAAEAVRSAGYIGPVGIDTFEERDGGAVVSDVNARLNASAFLGGVPLRNGRVDFFGFGMLEKGAGSLAAFEQRCLDVRNLLGCDIESCFSPVDVGSAGIAINFRIEGDRLSGVTAAARMLSQGSPAFTSLSIERLTELACRHDQPATV